jgi:hypothetical protein
VKKTRVHFAAAPLRIQKDEAVEKLYFIAGADAAIKIFEICAAAKCDVLAIVHMLAVRQDIGGRAASEEWA